MATLQELVNETTNIKNELVTCHTNLKNSLIEKGVECSDTDKMSTLINKIENTPIRKWADGVFEVLENIGETSTAKTDIVIDFSLDFTPTLAFCIITYCKYRASNGSSNIKNIGCSNLGETTVTGYYVARCSIGSLSDAGLVINTQGLALQANSQIKWYVFE